MTTHSALDIYKTVKDVDKRLSTNVDSKAVDRWIIATSIILRESGGNDKIVNTKGNTPAGSRDRGWWQFNDHWHPDVTDAQAFDPVVSTEIAWRKSDGFTNWDAWDGVEIKVKGEAVDAAKESGDAGSVGIDDVVREGIDKVTDIIPWADSLAKLLGKILSGTFWKRIGIAALGAAIIIAALIVIFGKDAVEAASEVKPV